MFSPSKSSLTTRTDAGAGLRIALVGNGFDNDTNKNAVVFANEKYDQSATRHISGVGENKEAKKTDYRSLYIASGSADEALGTEAVSHKDKKGYLGTFVPTTANTDVQMSVHVVAWFEGTDSHVVSTQALSEVSAQLGFKVVKAEAKNS